MKAIILARVSTEDQMREGFSIPAQLNRAREYANARNLEIKSEYQFDESSTKDQRKKFEKVILEIKKSKEKIALVVETIDRLQRSFKESVLLDELRKLGKLDIHFIRENLVIHKDSNSSDIIRWDMGVMFAKSYVLQLSDNVKRSIEQKLKNGEWIGQAPLGYLNDKANKKIIIDPTTSKFIVKTFELYATGGYSLKDILKIINLEGLRTKKGTKILKSHIHRILVNPFYYGVMFKNGKFYKGNHTPLISKTLFDRANDILNGKNQSRKKKHFFPHRGFMKCQVCGCLLTATKKKGHTYYYCTNGKGYCDQHKKYIPSKDIDKIMAEIFDKICFDKKLIELAYLAAKEKLEKTKDYNKTSKEILANQFNLIKQKQEKLLDGYLSNVISKEAYEKKSQSLNNEQITLESQIKTLTKDNPKITLEQTKNVFLIANKAKKEFLASDDFKKREKLEILLWNLFIENKKMASFQLKMPYQLLARTPKKRDFLTMQPQGDSNPCFRRERATSWTGLDDEAIN